MKEKFLPVGTIVLLKGGKKRLMITGFYVMDGEKKDKIYDYCGCLYPEGIVSADKNALFNHEQIEKIYYMGYVDEEEKNFKSKLEVALKSQNVLNKMQTETPVQAYQTPIIQPQPMNQQSVSQPTLNTLNTINLNQQDNNQ